MNTLTVQTSTNNYEIVIEEGIRFSVSMYLKKDYSSVFIITDDTVASLYAGDVSHSLQKQGYIVKTEVIPSGEISKSMEMYETLQTSLLEAGMDRKGLIIALGGGVVGDLAGFVAATFMRGIDYIQMPTTILAHDSSVGGKVAINHPYGKNLIGSFYPPAAVLYDTDTLSSLPVHEIRSGYAELIKEACIGNAEFLETLLNVSLDSISTKQLKNHLCAGIQVKQSIVEKDEKEANIRMFLNFGHTLAHAIETELGYGQLTHGEAVAIGILFALRMSEQEEAVRLPSEEIKRWFYENHYPCFPDRLDVSKLIEHMKSDKKTEKQQIQMVLLQEIESPVMKNVSDEKLREALETFMEELNNAWQ
ncbi:MAG TPA: 3-dehydroquinate synthase [Pseudogracilibacillus sp.]|nr:3-dehydroquinate synthase [Pseudogracilibacillus sp.]